MSLRLDFTESAKRDLVEIDAQTIELFGLLAESEGLTGHKKAIGPQLG